MVSVKFQVHIFFCRIDGLSTPLSSMVKWAEARATPAHVLEKTGVCIPMMEAHIFGIYSILCALPELEFKERITKCHRAFA